MRQESHSTTLTWPRVLATLAVVMAAAAPAAPQGGTTRRAGEESPRQLELEARFAAALDASRLRDRLATLTAAPHPAGSEGAARVAESIAAMLRSWGFEVELETFYVPMPVPAERMLEVLSPRRFRASLREPSLPGRDAAGAGSLPPYNAFSSDGEVVARAVYANHGLADDYRLLEERGVEVEGAIVVARQGRAFRGVKPRLAAARGALGLVLYSDPGDGGSASGVPYPDGPFLPDGGVQRGSVLDVPRRPGDPRQPGAGRDRAACLLHGGPDRARAHPDPGAADLRERRRADPRCDVRARGSGGLAWRAAGRLPAGR